MSSKPGQGPLAGVRVIEIAGLGPVPYCGMMLADMGAEVIMVERPEPVATGQGPRSAMERSRRYLCLDLKNPAGREVLLQLVARSDALIEGFRPGVAERLGIGPADCLQRNPRLVYGRVTGWGREGPLAAAAGHDLNYLALSGLLHTIGRVGEKPVPPLNVVGDFGGGGLLLAFGVVCALLQARVSGRGQVVDAAMVDGAASFMAPFIGGEAWGFDERPGRGLLAGAAHYYDTYETRDGGFVSVAAIEPQFYALLIERLGLDAARFAVAGFPALDAATRGERWPALKQELAVLFRSRTRAEWCQLLEGTDACFAPVLALSEALRHPHNLARSTYVDVDGRPQPAPAPRFSGTPPAAPSAARPPGADTRALLAELGMDDEQLIALRQSGALGQAFDAASD